MSGASTPTGPSPKLIKGKPRRSSAVEKRADASVAEEDSDWIFSTVGLGCKLDGYIKELLEDDENLQKTEPDLAGFDKSTVDSPGRFIEDREAVISKKHFDSAGRTALNFADASVAGAKVVIDERTATRSMTKRLAEETGADENSLLYPGIPEDSGSDLQSAVAIGKDRKSKMIESFVDLQSQMKFKRTVLNKVAQQSGDMSSSYPRARRKTRDHPNLPNSESKKARLEKTPTKQVEVNPLASGKIMDDYAEMVANEVAESSGNKKRLAPIPLMFDRS